MSLVSSITLSAIRRPSFFIPLFSINPTGLIENFAVPSAYFKYACIVKWSLLKEKKRIQKKRNI